MIPVDRHVSCLLLAWKLQGWKKKSRGASSSLARKPVEKCFFCVCVRMQPDKNFKGFPLECLLAATINNKQSEGAPI